MERRNLDIGAARLEPRPGPLVAKPRHHPVERIAIDVDQGIVPELLVGPRDPLALGPDQMQRAALAEQRRRRSRPVRIEHRL